MKNFLNTMKLLTFTFKFKLTMVMMGLFMIFGFGTVAINTLEGQSEYIGYFWGPFVSIFVLQCLFNVLYAKMVVVSPKYKKLIIEGTGQIYLFMAVVMYLLYTVLVCFVAKYFDVYFDLNVATFEYVITAICSSIYIQVYYRNMFLGILSLASIVYFAGISSVGAEWINKLSALDIKTGTVFACGFASMICGFVIVNIVGRILYRFSFSDKVMKMQLSRIK